MLGMLGLWLGECEVDQGRISKSETVGMYMVGSGK